MKQEVLVASKCGAVLGKYILTIQRNPVDPNYSRDVQENKLRTSIPIYLYSINPILVKKTEIVETANNGRFVEYNGDPTLRIPLITNDEIDKLIPKPCADSVRKAIAKYENTNERTIFIDYPALTKEVMALNQESHAQLTNFINKLLSFGKTLKDANEAELSACKVAMADEGIDVSNLFTI